MCECGGCVQVLFLKRHMSPTHQLRHKRGKVQKNRALSAFRCILPFELFLLATYASSSKFYPHEWVSGLVIVSNYGTLSKWKTGKGGNFVKTGVGGLPNLTSMFLLFFYKCDCYKMEKVTKKTGKLGENSHIGGEGWGCWWGEPIWEKFTHFPVFYFDIVCKELQGFSVCCFRVILVWLLFSIFHHVDCASDV